MFKISREIHAVMTTEPAIKWPNGTVEEKKRNKMAGTGTMQMDPLFLAMSFYRRRKFEECAEVCTQLLKKNPYDQVFYSQGRSEKNVMIFPCHFFSCLPFNSRWQCNVWYFDILQRIIFFSFRSLKIQFLSIFRLIRRHGV